ncbi:MAG: indole-3-glycerol phosphate synthase TrpC [Dehalococcoidia bacterium]|nr:indole-3-glycerol phosphate synthase TrpC [Dehalococcoidia bacterium]RLC65058.1 MAG: indole-3-glycerol phosphate synthase TrpC [Chloroflexota bacterium]
MLDKIIAQKKEEVEQRKKIATMAYLQEFIAQQKPALDLAPALKGNHIRLIAEVKQASPSRGMLSPSFNPTELAQTYAEGGAAAISVLTEANYFMGSIEHLTAIKEVVRLPLLRKDFIFDPYQVYESRAYGADALLLIAAILSQKQLKELVSLSHSLGLRCLVEVHNEVEVERAILSEAKIIGINNRDLNTFSIDINMTRLLRPLIPQERIVVSESGIKSRKDVEKLGKWGADAVLVGEALVTASNVMAKMKELIGE